MQTQTVPFQFTGQLYPFQEKVLEWSQSIHRGIIGLDMGLGKTVIMLAMIAQKQYQHTLIVVPLSIIQQWRQCVSKFTTLPDSQMAIYQGPSRLKLDLAQYTIVLTTYDVVRYDFINRQSPLWKEGHPVFDCLVMDEAHILHKKRTKIYAVCEQLKDTLHPEQAIWLMTGTMIHNKYADFRQLRDFLELQKNAIESRETYYIRVTKAQSGLQLPEKSIHKHYLNFAEEQHAEEYDQLYTETKEILQQDSNQSQRINLIKILRLRQCCNHIDATLPPEEAKNPKFRHDQLSSAKFTKILQLLQETPVEDKVIIFSQWTQSLTLLGQRLKSEGIIFLTYQGDQSSSARQAVLQRFKDEPVKVLLMTIKSGGVGLDLSYANHVILMESWWNNALEQQAIDRVYRIGQRKKVEIHHLYMKETIEDWVEQMKNEKGKIEASFYDENIVYKVDQDLLSLLLAKFT
uniref:Helicase n=1 Tax=viral metagenome TaxID=1070528 RepID=A0A6C0BJK5_9ZZZZ